MPIMALHWVPTTGRFLSGNGGFLQGIHLFRLLVLSACKNIMVYEAILLVMGPPLQNPAYVHNPYQIRKNPPQNSTPYLQRMLIYICSEKYY